MMVEQNRRFIPKDFASDEESKCDQAILYLTTTGRLSTAEPSDIRCYPVRRDFMLSDPKLDNPVAHVVMESSF
jgi:hypothetical protein